jgi:hypothetical protein
MIMIKNQMLGRVFFVVAILISQLGIAGVLEPPHITILQSIVQLKVYFNDWSKNPIMNVEVTPWAVSDAKPDSLHSFLVSTENTYLCSTNINLFDLKTVHEISRDHCALIETADVSANRLDVSSYWKRDFYGAFSAHVIGNSPKQTIYFVNHGELKDEVLVPDQNGLDAPSCRPAPDIGYGSDLSWSKSGEAAPACDPSYVWPSYNAFISMSSLPYNLAAISKGRQAVTEYGPILWPSNGYIELSSDRTHWTKATDGGIRHPSSIIADGHIYVFYEDLSQGSEIDGRGPGIKVARAPVISSAIDSKSFRTYFNYSFDDLALPQDFDLNHPLWQSKGGRASSLFPSDVFSVSPTPYTGQITRRVSDEIGFSVARMIGTGWFIGVANQLSLGTTLRISKDLLTWSEPVVIPGTASNFFGGGVDLQTDIPLLYARFANADSESNNDIDPRNFYVIGTQTALYNGKLAKVVNAIHLAVTLPPAN